MSLHWFQGRVTWLLAVQVGPTMCLSSVCSGVVLMIPRTMYAEHTNGVSCRCQFIPNPILTQCNNALLLLHAFLSHVWYAITSFLTWCPSTEKGRRGSQDPPLPQPKPPTGCPVSLWSFGITVFWIAVCRLSNIIFSYLLFYHSTDI